MKEFIRKVAAKVSNFKLLSRIMIFYAEVVAIVSVLAFVAFQASNGKDENGVRIPAFGVEGAHHQLVGMFCFLVFAANLVLSVVIIYQAVKYAFPKSKISPKKSLPILCVVNGGVSVVSAVFCILAATYDHSLIPVFWYVNMALFLVVALVNATMLIPVLKAHYFMPPLIDKDKLHEGEKNYFDGGALSHVIRAALVGLGSACTLCIAFPWLLCWFERYEVSHTVIEGNRGEFKGKACEYFCRTWVIYLVVCIFTAGVFALWIPAKVKHWVIANSDYSPKAE